MSEQVEPVEPVEPVLAVEPVEPVLAVDGLSKAFGAVQANDGVTFRVCAGEVHALLGENGAGKSTLVKSLYGIHQPDSGRILLGGRAERLTSPARARDLGIGMVFQDMRLIPALTVWENVALHLRDTPRVLAPRRIRQEIARASARYGLDVDPAARVRDLSIGEWQRIELVKVLLGGARILILDEPTSVLTPQETDALFDVLGRLTADGVAVILIAHKIREVRQIADRLTVLRAGRTVVADADPATFTNDALVRAMVGTSVVPVRRDAGRRTAGSEPLLTLTDATLTRPDGRRGLDSVSLEVSKGEILGIAGIAGNGQEQLADVIVGASALDSGTISHAGAPGTGADPRALRRAGVVDVVAHPARQFVVQGMTIGAHAALWDASRSPSGRRFDVRAAVRRLRGRDERAGLRIADPARRLDQLSGGNVQRVMLTLALTEDASLIVASYPTRGLDVRTTERTHRLLLQAREAGIGIVLISEDLDELLALSDRIAVLSRGRVARTVDGAAATRDELGSLMTQEAA